VLVAPAIQLSAITNYWRATPEWSSCQPAAGATTPPSSPRPVVPCPDTHAFRGAREVPAGARRSAYILPLVVPPGTATPSPHALPHRLPRSLLWRFHDLG
jgi:hypothetical protein